MNCFNSSDGRKGRVACIALPACSCLPTSRTWILQAAFVTFEEASRMSMSLNPAWRVCGPATQIICVYMGQGEKHVRGKAPSTKLRCAWCFPCCDAVCSQPTQ
jgi:hypothetical protein